MNRLVRALVAAAVLTGGDALAYVRSTTIPDHPEAGLCLWWRNRQLSYAVNASAITKPGCQDAAAAEALIGASFATWSGATRAGESQPCTDVSFLGCGATTQTSTGNDGVNLMVFRKDICDDTALVPVNDPCRQSPGACAAKYNCWEHDVGYSTVALTTTTVNLNTGEILDADIELHAWNGTYPGYGSYFTCAAPTDPLCSSPPALYGQSGCNAVDVGTVMTHEIGHLLGLDHTCWYPAPYDSCPLTGSVMKPAAAVGAAGRALAPDDVEGVCTVYPAGAATATCGGVVAPASNGTATCDPPKEDRGGGCSTGGGTGAGALLGAIVAAWRARRGRRG